MNSVQIGNIMRRIAIFGYAIGEIANDDAAPPTAESGSENQAVCIEATNRRKHLAPIVCGLLIAFSGLSYAEEPIPAGRWICEGNGVCVNPDAIHYTKPLASAPAIVYDRGVNKRGYVVRNCYSGVVTTYGVADMREDWPIQDDFGWMCLEGLMDAE